MPHDDSDPSRMFPVILERVSGVKQDIEALSILVRDLDSRVRTVEMERSQRLAGIEDRVVELEQWRRDLKTAEDAKVKVKEPYTRLWWLGVGAVVVMAMSGFAVIMWRIVVAATTAGK